MKHKVIFIARLAYILSALSFIGYGFYLCRGVETPEVQLRGNIITAIGFFLICLIPLAEMLFERIGPELRNVIAPRASARLQLVPFLCAGAGIAGSTFVIVRAYNHYKELSDVKILSGDTAIGHSPSNYQRDIPEHLKFTPQAVNLELWDSKPIFIVSKPEARKKAEDLATYLESVAKSHSTSLQTGFIPNALFSSDKRIAFTRDLSKGAVRGQEKLTDYLARIEKRCPTYFSSTYKKLPLGLYWDDGTMMHDGKLQQKNHLAHHTSPSPAFRQGKLKGGVQLMDSYAAVFGRFMTTAYTQTPPFFSISMIDFPTQSYLENTGKDITADPQYEQSKTYVDTNFAHEFGHHIFSEWAFANGRNKISTRYFNEHMAEIFRIVCYGSAWENPTLVKSEVLKPVYADYFTNLTFDQVVQAISKPSKFGWSDPYRVYAIEEVIAADASALAYNPDAFMRDIVETWRLMQGRRIWECPDDDSDLVKCRMKWAQSDPQATQNNAKLSFGFTLAEFYTLFPKVHGVKNENIKHLMSALTKYYASEREEE